jgi:AcrR family transcriptional regulator
MRERERVSARRAASVADIHHVVDFGFWAWSIMESMMSTESVASEPARGYANGRATKQTLVARAAEAFSDQGFQAASLRSIARAAGVDHSTLLHHFGTKTDLLLAVLEWQDEQHVSGELPGGASAAEANADEIAQGFVDAARRNLDAPGLVRLLSMLTAEAGAPEHPAREVLQRRQHMVRDIMASVIRDQRESGALADDGLTPEAGAAVVVATWEGLQVYDALHPGEIDVPDLLARTLTRAFGL